MIVSSDATFRKNYLEKQAGDFQVNLHVPVKFPLLWSQFCATCCGIFKKKRSIKKYCLWETYSTLENARRARLEPSANNGQQRGVGSYYKWCCNVLLRNCWRGRKWFSVSTTEPNFLHSVAETLIFFIYTFSVTWSLVLSFFGFSPLFFLPFSFITGVKRDLL